MDKQVLSAIIQGACTILGGVLAAYISRSKPEDQKTNTPGTKMTPRWLRQITEKRWIGVVIGFALGFVLGVVVNLIIFRLFVSPNEPKPTQTSIATLASTSVMSPTTPPTTHPTQEPTDTLAPTPIVSPTITLTTQPAKEPTATSQPVLLETLTPTPSEASYEIPELPQEIGLIPQDISEVSPEIEAFGLPSSAPNAVVWFESALWVQFDATFERLEMVEAETRFRLGRTPTSLPGRTLRMIDRSGNVAGTLSFPFSGDVMTMDDQENLWIAQGDALKKFAPTANGQDYEEIDSYAPAAGRFPHTAIQGLTWDGSHLWLLVDNLITRLEQGAQPMCRIGLPFGMPPQPSWYGYRGLAWDGQLLWAAHQDANLLFRVDPNACR